jgi:hypothetical protein
MPSRSVMQACDSIVENTYPGIHNDLSAYRAPYNAGSRRGMPQSFMSELPAISEATVASRGKFRPHPGWAIRHSRLHRLGRSMARQESSA